MAGRRDRGARTVPRVQRRVLRDDRGGTDRAAAATGLGHGVRAPVRGRLRRGAPRRRRGGGGARPAPRLGCPDVRGLQRQPCEAGTQPRPHGPRRPATGTGLQRRGRRGRQAGARPVPACCRLDGSHAVRHRRGGGQPAGRDRGQGRRDALPGLCRADSPLPAQRPRWRTVPEHDPGARPSRLHPLQPLMRRPRTPYSEALRTGGVLAPFTATEVGRLPLSMAPLGVLLLVQAIHGSYSVAGLVTGAFALGTAVGGPWWGSTLDGQPHGRVVLCTSLASSLALASLAVAVVDRQGLVLLLALAATAGLTFPPFGPAMRETWRRGLDQDCLRSAGFALDAVAVETIFVAGPLLLSLFVVRTPAVVPLLVTAALLVGGGIGYSVHPVVRGQGRRRPPSGRQDGASARRGRTRARRAPWSRPAGASWRPWRARAGRERGPGSDGGVPPTWGTAGMLP